jgi:gliding motility-associated-like protein
MKKIYLLLTLIALSGLTQAQVSTWLWAKRAGGNADQQGRSIAADANGNIYITGYISGTNNDFSSTILAAAGGHDIFIAKYDSLGNLLWARSAGGSSYDEGMGIAVDASGNAYICGSFEGTAQFSGSPSVNLASSGGKDIFIAKYDASGNIQWAKKAGGSQDDSGISICTNGSYIFLTGYFRSASTFGTGSLTSTGGKDIFIACYGAVTGTFNWVMKGGSIADDSGEAIALDGNYIYTTGTYTGSCSFANFTGSLTSNGGQDAFVIKYDINLNGYWGRSAGGLQNDAGKAIAVRNSDVYVGGYFKSSIDFYNFSALAVNLPAAAGDDAFLTKYDAGTGDVIWARSQNGTDDEHCTGIVLDATGNVFTSGEFKGTLPGVNLTANDYDIYITKYDPSGNEVDGISAGGSNIDAANGIAYCNYRIYTTGYFKSSSTQFTGTSPLTSVGNEDIFVAKVGCRALGGNASASSDSICAGNNTVLTLANYSGNIQWQSSPANSNSWTNIPGASSASLNVSPAANTDYRAIVTQFPCDAGYSNTLTIFTRPLPQLVTSAGTSVCAGDTAQLSVSGASSYVWSPASGLNTITGDTVNAFPSSTTVYTVTGTDSNGCSSAASINVQVKPLPSIAVAPANSTICNGGQLSLLAAGAQSYSWIPAQDLSSTTGALVIASPTLTVTYSVTGTATNGCSSSATATVNVDQPVSSNTISADQDICNGTQPLPLAGSAPSGGNGLYTYAWEESADNINWTPASGLNSLVGYTPPALTDTTYYRRRVTSGSCSGAFSSVSNTTTIRVQPAITGNSISSDQTLCSGSAPSLLTGAQPAGGDGAYTYQWLESSDGQSWAPAAGANSLQNYSAPSLSDTMYYMRTVSSGACTGTSASSSNTVSIYVQPAITGNIISSSQTICAGSTPAALTGSAITGGNGLYVYMWEESANGIGWTAAAGNNTQQGYAPSMLTSSTWYKRTVSSGVCADTSQPVTITVNQLPTASISGSSSICAGDGEYLSIQLTGAAPWSLVYSDGTGSYPVNNIFSANYALYINPPSNATYTISSVSDYNGCNGTSSGSASVTVYPKPTANAGTDANICGVTFDLSAVPSTGNGTWAGPAGTVFSNPSDPNATVTLPGYGSYTLTWTETNSICSDSDNVIVQAYEPVQAPDAGIDQDIYFTDAVVLNAAVPAAGAGAWSVLSGGGTLSNPADPHASISSMPNGDIVLQWTVSNGACGSASDDVTLHVHHVIIPTGFSPNGDNVNDAFFIEGIENFNSSLAVFTRWGAEVFKASPYRNDWSGNNQQGMMLPEDTYFYILNIGDNTFNGYIVIKRK